MQAAHLRIGRRGLPWQATTVGRSRLQLVACNAIQKRQRRPENPIVISVVSAATEVLRAVGVGAKEYEAMQQQAPPVQRLSPGDTAGVKARIAADFEQGYIVTGIIDTAIYDPDCYFADPTVAFSGLALWQRNLQLLLPFLIQPSVRLLHMKEVKTQEGLPPQLRAEWELRTHLALPWRPLIAILGATDYYLNSDGNKVVEHVETWNVSGVQAVAQIFKPSELSLWRLHR